MEIVKEYLVKDHTGKMVKVLLTDEGVYFMINGKGEYVEIAIDYFKQSKHYAIKSCHTLNIKN